MSCEICSNKDEHIAGLKTQVYCGTTPVQPLRSRYHWVVTGPQTSVLSETELIFAVVGRGVLAGTQMSFPGEGQSISCFPGEGSPSSEASVGDRAGGNSSPEP